MVIDHLWISEVNWDFSILLQPFFVQFTQFFIFNKGLFGDGGFFQELGPASAMLLL